VSALFRPGTDLHAPPLEASGSNGSTATVGGGTALALELEPEKIAAELEPYTAAESLEWAFENFGERLYIACSFQKTTSVMVDLAAKVNPDARFFYLDTDVLFPETYETRDALAERYAIEFDRFHNMSLADQARLLGDELWRRNPDACCGIRKVEPMKEALSGVDCWVSGIRREDSQTRASAPKFAWDKRFGLWKLNPLADWSERDVWNYINDNRIPYNPLHDRGYPSIGCTHCTQPVGPGQPARSGRWAGVSKSECGIN
jgi:phosphoadenosine phosphosulfate reductase